MSSSKNKQGIQGIQGIKAIPLQPLGNYQYQHSDWTTTAFMITRKSLDSDIYNEELQYNSIYLIVGWDEKKEERVYVGQAKKRNKGDSVLKRLREHTKSKTEKYKDIWEYAIVLTNTEDAWGATELSNLEYLLYNEIPSKVILNSVEPNSSGIDESKDYNEKIRQIKTYVQAIGCRIFTEDEHEKTFQVEPVTNNVKDLQKGQSDIPEITTPQVIVDRMIEDLPEEVFNPDTTFLDLACKGGEYLRGLYDKLMQTESLIALYKDTIERSNHILEHQLYGIALSQVSLDRTTKALKGYKHNIKIIPEYISYIKNKRETEKFQEWLKEIGQVKIDVIIGNPPYTEYNGGGNIKSVAPLCTTDL